MRSNRSKLNQTRGAPEYVAMIATAEELQQKLTVCRENGIQVRQIFQELGTPCRYVIFAQALPELSRLE